VFRFDVQIVKAVMIGSARRSSAKKDRNARAVSLKSWDVVLVCVVSVATGRFLTRMTENTRILVHAEGQRV